MSKVEIIESILSNIELDVNDPFAVKVENATILAATMPTPVPTPAPPHPGL